MLEDTDLGLAMRAIISDIADEESYFRNTVWCSQLTDTMIRSKLQTLEKLRDYAFPKTRLSTISDTQERMDCEAGEAFIELFMHIDYLIECHTKGAFGEVSTSKTQELVIKTTLELLKEIGKRHLITPKAGVKTDWDSPSVKSLRSKFLTKKETFQKASTGLANSQRQETKEDRQKVVREYSMPSRLTVGTESNLTTELPLIISKEEFNKMMRDKKVSALKEGRHIFDTDVKRDISLGRHQRRLGCPKESVRALRIPKNCYQN
eukprot:TRINITY_DN3646_c0_g1_i1.p1 TRINITY_DN3646_c0_g1~~TRINITY_DN3646_c0_g1_i1.p1  ORF type:complete len:263 (+),score=113.59 TRINITY_DN3646_c0_g1_i1:304-1092(+)